jgi:hypothetical protein
MNDPDPQSSLTDAFLDRIVDGGLSPAELRAAIDLVGREPDGWKRCALAFLEAQCWRESFQGIDDRLPALPEGIARSGSPSPRLTRHSSAGWRRFALAAGIAALAFVLGWHAHPARVVETRDAGASPALEVENRSSPPDVPAIAEGPASDESARDDPGPSVPIPVVRTVGHLRIGSAAGAPTVPILAGPGIDEQWVRNQPPPITEHQQALLEQQGYQIDRRRRLITARLADGRRVAVPIDQVQVRYTGIEPL